MLSYNSDGKATFETMATPRILIVEDEAKLSTHLESLLKSEMFSTFTCGTYRDLQLLLEMPLQRFDLVVLDRLLHGQDSANLLGQLKGKMPEAKILVLSAVNTPAEKAALLDQGADDYVAKPFAGEELVARLRALLRRSVKSIGLGNVTLDLEARSMNIAGFSMPLTNKEFVLLRTLMTTPGKVFSKTHLHEKVWGMTADVESNVVEATINKLRKRFKEAGASPQIKNQRNSGYWIEE